jgi:hypothetical protein
MGKLKISLENIQGKMSRKEMKSIMAGKDEAVMVTCFRTNGSSSDQFSSDSSAIMGSWAGFWTNAGWAVNCTNGFQNNIQFV